jgi:uncharacterized phage protein gp47/JayE
MSFARPTLSDLIARDRADLDARLPGADSRLRRSTLDVLARTHAGALHGAYGYLDYIAEQILPDTADAEHLARWATIFGLTRKAAVLAAGTATLTGTNGIVAPAGTVLMRADGARYLITADATIAGGTAAASIEAEDAGADAGMDTGQQLTFASPIAGIQAIATIAAPGIAGGLDEEDDASLRARLLARIAQQPAGGAEGDYIRWAREVPEVTRAWVYPNMNGLGTVGLTFTMDGRDNIIPLTADVNAVAAHIDPLRPVTADVDVFAPVADPLNFTIDLTPDTTAVRNAVAAELRDLIAREAEPGGTLLISHIREAISIAAGETDHVLTAPSANVTAAAGEITVFGAITWA